MWSTKCVTKETEDTTEWSRSDQMPAPDALGSNLEGETEKKTPQSSYQTYRQHPGRTQLPKNTCTPLSRKQGVAGCMWSNSPTPH